MQKYADNITDIHQKKKYKQNFVLCVLLMIVVFIFLINIAKGSVNISITDVIKVIFGREVEENSYHSIVMNIRFPRAMSAVIGGACLALSGLFLQIFFKNPIVEPYVLGISSGSTLFVGLIILGGISFGIRTPSPMFLFLGAFAGAMIVMLIVIFFARRVKSITTLLIVGVMTGFLCNAATSILTAFADQEQLHGFTMWALGSFSGFSWAQVKILYLIALPLIFLSLFLSKPLNVMLFGEKYAATMGLNVKNFQIVIIFLASVLTAVVTAFAGPISFIGLAVPHIMRILLKTTDNRVLIPAVILGGALMTSLCDLVARQLLSPIELPLGAITSFIGAPIVVFFMLRKGGEM